MEKKGQFSILKISCFVVVILSIIVAIFLWNESNGTVNNPGAYAAIVGIFALFIGVSVN